MEKEPKFEQPKPEEENDLLEEDDEEAFQSYFYRLGLKPDDFDFDKKILDVGAGSAAFAKWAKERGVSSEIYSLEPDYKKLRERQKSVAGLAEQLPFQESIFDLVVSHCAAPNIFRWEDKNKVKESFLEMLRVLKPGGEIRLTAIKGYKNKTHRELSQAIDRALEELKSQGIEVEEIRQPEYDIYRVGREGNPKGLVAEAVLIRLRKLK